MLVRSASRQYKDCEAFCASDVRASSATVMAAMTEEANSGRRLVLELAPPALTSLQCRSKALDFGTVTIGQVHVESSDEMNDVEGCR